ncbi:hypothetical protein [Pyxidicoccus xibeiensis]|uniref:hypothetical protein n=1 Tax=Pyxidicoccus xibeiensis TaxID=2906759 RepID=UPI0020A75836|nr:hypothetical protein [Pyxidicoccus xibeiensis]MCP3142964.1 hypothetical protein [Pyxidicoccus xibeiensis]
MQQSRSGVRTGLRTKIPSACVVVSLSLSLAACAGPEGLEDSGEVLTGEVSQGVQVGSSMDCPTGTGGTCTVLNMPLLHQSSSLIDVDVQWMSPWGCYDTSIATVLNTALANRTSTRPLVDRTLAWDSIVAGNNGGTPPLTTTKVYEQVTQQYRWANATVPMYFHEMLKDFDTAFTTVRKFPAGCNPDVYGSCAWSTSVLVNDTVGAAYRDFSEGTLHVTNDYIKGQMNAGFAMMIAYGRYTPKKVWDSRLGGYRMTFMRDSQHKVAFSGYQPGTYPLRINDVGDGQRYNVSVTSDVALIGTFDGIAASSVVAWDFPNGKKAQTFVRYDPAVSPTTQVFFVDHVDGLSLSLPKAGPVRQVFSGTWSAGWTSLMPFTLNGEPHQLAYNRNTGAVHFDTFYANANGTNTVWSYTWGSGFTHFAPYYINKHPYFIAYNSTTGDAHYDTFPSNLQGPIIKAIKTWPAGLTTIEPFVMNGENYLLLYNKNTGAVRYEKLNATGSDSTTTWTGTWGTGFTHFASHDIGGTPHLVVYNASTGAIHYDRILANGVSVLAIETLATGLNLEALDFNGPGHVLAYQPGTGSAATKRLGLDGTTSADAFAGTTFASATAVVPFMQGGKPYVLLYNENTGTVRSYELSMF